ncbi:hypothetical protein J8M21_03980 [Pseudoalteromonas luteoviolacea]|uniref:hypothetical protein n=2 Tax=Pseudoalteromonas luteoviolacea TaxID=43657 RepID=UPI001B3A19FA|nr:hypothetical protein [Pseudoalteromonas luteoviolacea]MBQ4876364.1 hypothetical protein [Pseudoalteromonas luteoviolacea]MBQ4904994.1 hypothetical protein [Pseudoalteromonas luteoviolacea]
MMLTQQNTSILCPTNDLEAHSIIELAKLHGFTIFEGPSFWGATLADALAEIDLNTCKPNLLAIELPDLDGEAQQYLDQTGIVLHTLDHHQYPQSDARHTLSAIEQFAALFSLPLSDYEQLVAANDKGFIPGLLAAGASYQQMRQIRDDEARVRGVAQERAQAFTWLNTALSSVTSTDDVVYLACPADYVRVMSEVAQFPTQAAYEQALSSGTELKLSQVVIQYQKQNTTTQIEVLANKNRNAFSELVANWPYSSLQSWFGGQAPNYFFGASAKKDATACSHQFDELYDQIKHILK